MKKDLDSVNFQLTGTDRINKNIIIFSGMSPDEIEAAKEKIDFKETRQKFFDRPLYCKAMKTITPTKKDTKADVEDKQDDKGADKNEQNEDIEEEIEAEEGESMFKPKLGGKSVKKNVKNKRLGPTSQPGNIDSFPQNPFSQCLELQ